MGIISYRVRSPGDSCLVTGGGELGWGLWRVSDGAMQLCRVCVCEDVCKFTVPYCLLSLRTHIHIHTLEHASLHFVYGLSDVT